MTAATFRRHLNSVLSRGLGYESTPPGGRVDVDGVRGYYIDFSAKTRSASARTPRTLLPAARAQLALGWWERMLAGEPAAEGQFVEICDLLEQSSIPEDGARLWPYQLPLAKYRLGPSWISALAQAQGASVFVRAFLHSGTTRYRDLALGAVRPLLRETPPTVVTRLPAGPALEECPSEPPSLILNGWIYASWGLRDVALGLGSEEAAAMLDDTVACLVSTLPRYDAGWWSRYSLFPFRLPDLAKPFYHRLHVSQLEVMSQLSGDRVFQEFADRWRSYDRPERRAALLVQKAALVATGYK